MFALSVMGQNKCCPEFKLFSDFISCSQEDRKPDGEGKGFQLTSCLDSKQKYIITPEVPGFNYTWEVEGGTPTSTTGNNIEVQWGNINPGSMTIYIESEDGLCKDTLNAYIYLQDSPTAQFEISTDTTVCMGQNISFEP